MPADVGAGFINGLIGGTTGLAGVFAPVWCQLRGGLRDRQRAVFQPVGVASFVVCSLWLGGRGEIPPDTYWLIPLGLSALIAGCWLGWKLYGPLDESKFRKVVLILLLVSGTVLVFGDKDGFVRIARTSSWRARTPLWSRSRTRPLQGNFIRAKRTRVSRAPGH